jgi:transcriptional/translational regulatory protein YebC/TACO1
VKLLSIPPSRIFPACKGLEDKSNILSAELQRIPASINDLDDAAADEIGQLMEKLDEDDDVQAVFHNMR